MKNRNAGRVILFALVLVGAVPAVYPKDDDLPYAISLVRAGHTRLAVRELKQLTSSDDLHEKCLAHYHLARVYEQMGDLAARDRYDDLFIELAAGSDDPEIRLARSRVVNRLNGNRLETLTAYVNRIGAELAQAQPDLAAVGEWRRAARDAAESLLAVRRELLAGYDALPHLDGEQEVARGQAAYELASTLYTASFVYMGDAEETRLRYLAEADELLKPLAFMFEQVIGIHYQLGLISQALGRTADAARSFAAALECRVTGGADEMRQDAFRRAVHGLGELRDFAGCARTAAGFLIEYPSEEIRMSATGQSIRIDLADALCGMEAADYAPLREMLASGPDRMETVRTLLLAVMMENGPLSARAGERLAELDTGFAGSIARGVMKYNQGEYGSAVSMLQNGLAAAPADLEPGLRVSFLGLGWHYLGQAFYRQNMLLPALIAFKQGYVAFIPDLAVSRLPAGAPAAEWVARNRENWRICAQNYNAAAGSPLAREILKEALLARDPRTAGREQDGANLNLAILACNDGNFKEAAACLDRVAPDAAEYPAALRLKARAAWRIAEAAGDQPAMQAAVALNDRALEAIRERMDGAEAGKAVQRWRQLFQEARSEGVWMLFETGGFDRIIAGIDAYGEDPAEEEARRISDLQYQFYALINAGPHGDDPGSLDRRLALLLKADTVISRLKKVPDAGPAVHTAVGRLAQRFLDLAEKLRRAGDFQKEKQALDNYSRCIREYFHGDAATGNANEMMAAAAVLIDQAGDFKAAAQLLEQALQMLTDARAGRMDPYADATRTMLVQARDLHFDRSEARAEWDMMVDCMYDGTQADGTVRGRDYFRNRPQESWEERPFNYTAAFGHLREAVMLEIGIDIPEKNGIVAVMDGANGQTAAEAWSGLLARYHRITGRETGFMNELNGFLDLCFDELRCREMLGRACLEAGMLDRARDLFANLDAYYLQDPAVKKGYADACLALARMEHDAGARKDAAASARLGYLEIRDLAAGRGPAGWQEYYDAELKIAECYAAVGDRASAANHIGNVLKLGTIPFPEGYEQKLIDAKGEYGQ